MNEQQFQKMKRGKGFIAALDQSGGSTPKTLELYGLAGTAYANDAEMFDLIHQMRCRIIASPAFDGDRILGTILFEMTMDRQIAGKGSAAYLWENKNIVPFLKIDRGLSDEVDGVQLMNPIDDLDALLGRATHHGVYGTKMRSFVRLAHESGVDAVISQQFEIARQIMDFDLVPIIEPEIDIHSPEKAAAEALLKVALLAELDRLVTTQQVILKLSLPERGGYYAELVAHPRVLRVAALSGGYTRAEADARLSRNHGVIASFSRALTEGLTAQQSDAQFNATLSCSIDQIYRASTA